MMSSPQRSNWESDARCQADNTAGDPVPTTSPVQQRSQKGKQQQHVGGSMRSLNDLHHLPPLRPQSTATHQQRSAKIAIPRLPREEGTSTAGSPVGEKHRVTHACEPCRHRKTKCSGERPTCKHCEDCKITCHYADGKRDRTRKQLGNMTWKAEEYEKLLRELCQRVEGADQVLIRKTLEMESTPEDEDGISVASSKRMGGVSALYTGFREAHDLEREADGGETQVSAGVGSTGSLDHINEDFNHSAATRATGFMGKNSELTWIQRLKKQTAQSSNGSDEDASAADTAGGPFGSSLSPLNESTYHCDDLTILVPDQVDPLEVPPRAISDALFQVYLDTVHPAFPIIGKINFISQYQRFSDNPHIQTGSSWKAILNLIYAIGAKYSHLVQVDWRGDDRDHLIYFTRARMLGFNADSMFGHADLQRVQITGLMAFYLTAINQVNRAWTLNGIAIRHALTLGLNLKNESKSVHDISKEIRYRVWWALCSTERLLGVMTGRPMAIIDTDCSVPLPLPFDEEGLFPGRALDLNYPAAQMLRRWSSQDSLNPENMAAAISTPSSTNSGNRMKASTTETFGQKPTVDQNQGVPASNSLYFFHHTKLSVLTSQVLDRLYRVGTMSQSWAQVQRIISTHESRLEHWRDGLPSVFDFTTRQRDQQFHRQRVSLGFFYYSTLTIICRPCLCRIDRKIPNQSGKARNFNRDTAAKCVHAARDMLDMLPNEPNSIGLYKVAPWWCLVHHLVQAATVLMLELSFRSTHLPTEVEQILDCAKKAVSWLRSMSEENLAAYRAYKMCDEMLRKVAPKVGREVDSMIQPIVCPSIPHLGSGLEDTQSIFATSGTQISPAELSALSETDFNTFMETMHQSGEQIQDLSFQPYMFTYYDEHMPQISSPNLSR